MLKLTQHQTILTKMLSCLVVIVGLFISPSIIWAQQANYVHDEANVVSAPMKEKLEKLLTELDEKRNLRIEEVILPSLNNQDPSKVVGELAQKIDAHETKAEYRALILYVTDSGYIQIYPNQKLSAILDEKSLANIVQTATKQLQEKNYDEMARVGVAGVFHYFQKNPETQVKNDAEGRSKTMINLLLIIVALVVVVGLIKFGRKQ
ncbi:TPM domain-containing protein [Candidatus Berkiella aquae]|uniref:TPM domain-containing protein n=1 Tax=Candidatus Berkiella aquae TaxID=295108 RepID=A0A0Q9YP11_9GAMM|nr:TPM domain-containing protein [Candidatus Berkiella aquae]MCS5712350.1 TPM domain-containing protein [Candidatus Berkiella aquae]